MTLNSVDWNTKIIIMCDGKIVTPQIGEWIDEYYTKCNQSKVQHLENNQIYIELDDGHDWKALSCDEQGNMVWTKLEAITRHPVVNRDGTDTILEVELESGRTVRATKGKSFLTLIDGKIQAYEGYDLKVGDILPIANSLGDMNGVTHFDISTIFPKTEWLHGEEVHKALHVKRTSGERHWFQSNQGKLFTVPYTRSDGFCDAFIHGKNSNEIRTGCIYPKRTRPNTSHIPVNIELNEDFGFFVGAYLAEGMSNTTQVCISNIDMKYLEKVQHLMNEWNVGTHIVSCYKNNGLSQSLIIHSTILSKLMTTIFGRLSYHKRIPLWVLQAPFSFARGLIDGYFSGDGYVSKDYNIKASSVSEELINGLSLLLIRYNIYSTIHSTMPKQKHFKSVSRCYTLAIPCKYSQIFAERFTLTIDHKQERLNNIRNRSKVRCSYTELNDIVWDKVKSIKETQPIHGWMYDLTVEKTHNFLTANGINMFDEMRRKQEALKACNLLVGNQTWYPARQPGCGKSFRALTTTLDTKVSRGTRLITDIQW